MIAWPSIIEKTLAKESISEIDDAGDRAWSIVHQVDGVIDYVMSLITSAKDLASKFSEAKKNSKKPGSKCKTCGRSIKDKQPLKATIDGENVKGEVNIGGMNLDFDLNVPELM